MTKQRNNTLDVLKWIASCMVVFIHVLFYGNTGVVFDALARFAVPLFFVISGFYANDITPEQIRNRILRILRLTAFAVTVYFLWDVLPLLARQDIPGLRQYFSPYVSMERLLKLLVFNVPLHTVHLWYLFAMEYVYILYWFAAVRKIPGRIIYGVSVVLLVIHLLLGEGLSVFGIVVPIPAVRNFALMGIPFFGLGLLANTYSRHLRKVPNWAIPALLILGALEAVFARFSFGKNEVFVGSLLMLLGVTVIFVKFPDIEYPPALISLAGCSTCIYLFHPLVSEILEKGYWLLHLDLGASVFLRMIHPLLVCAGATSLAYVLHKITDRRKA